ncbi:hypothetical protein F0U61_50200 [Archangium violaceum]|uniref:hypothetical protein n=1 Tax=Archangium violaceum TaxID=83451 RepID=UPI002B299079|nr:hypothetical protein F0U61_50200 [Archangium violaceum]
MSTKAARAKHILLWLLAIFASAGAALYCAYRALGHMLGFLRDEGVLMRGATSWLILTALFAVVCFQCALRFADSGKQY